MPANDIDFESLARFRFNLRKFLAFSAAEAKAVGIAPRQHQLLLTLRGLPTGTLPTIGALAARLLIRHHSAAELVTRMEKNGLVTRERSGHDARVVLVHITASGDEILHQLSQTHRDQLHTSGPALIAALNDAIAGVNRGDVNAGGSTEEPARLPNTDNGTGNTK